MKLLDIQRLVSRPDYSGVGYLGHALRSNNTDSNLAFAASILKFDLDDVFLWANSRCGRHFMDGFSSRLPPQVTDFKKELSAVVPELKEEVGE